MAKRSEYPVRLGEPSQLLEFAIRCRVERLRAEQGSALTWRAVADACEWSPTNLSSRISSGHLASEVSRQETVRRIQGFLDGHGGGGPVDLVTYADLVADTEGLRMLSVPGRFAASLLTTPITSYEQLLVACEALGSVRRSARSTRQASIEFSRLNGGAPGTGGPVDAVIEQAVHLITIPSRWNQMLLRVLGGMRDWSAEVAARVATESPAGWRAVRVLAVALRSLDREGAEAGWAEEFFRQQLRSLLEGIVLSAPYSLDPSRGFLEEALRHAAGDEIDGRRHNWDPTWRFAAEHLVRVGCDPRAPLRQRAFAALCVAERPATAEAARQIERSLAAGDSVDLTRVRRFIDHRILEAHGEQWEGSVDEVASTLLEIVTPASFGAIPPSLRASAAALVRKSVLFYDTSKRRRACDTIIVAGLGSEAAEVLAGALGETSLSPGVRDTTCAVLGYLGSPASGEALGVAAGERSDVRHSALMALAALERIEDETGVEAARSALEAEEPAVVEAATYAYAVRSWWDQEGEARQRAAHELDGRRSGDGPAGQLAGWGADLLSDRSPPSFSFGLGNG